MGEVESHGVSRVGKTVLARLMEFQVWHLPTGSMAQGFRKGTMASACHTVWEKAVPQLLP